MLEQTDYTIPDTLRELFHKFDRGNFMEKMRNVYIQMNHKLYIDGCKGHTSYIDVITPIDASKILLPILNLVPRDNLTDDEFYKQSSEVLIDIFGKLFAQKVAKNKMVSVKRTIPNIVLSWKLPSQISINSIDKWFTKDLGEFKIPDDIYTEKTFRRNRMYTDPIYLSNLLFVMYAVYKTKDRGGIGLINYDPIDMCAKSALIIIYARLYNGRLFKYYPEGRNKEVALVTQQNLRQGYILWRLRTPSELIFKRYLPDTITYLNNKTSEKYLNTSPHEIIYFFSRMWNKIEDLIQRVSKRYYARIKLNNSTNVELDKNYLINEQQELVDNIIVKMLSTNGVPLGWYNKHIVIFGKYETDKLSKILQNSDKLKFVISKIVERYYNTSGSLLFYKPTLNELLSFNKKMQVGSNVTIRVINKELDKMINKQFVSYKNNIKSAIYEFISIFVYATLINKKIKTKVIK